MEKRIREMQLDEFEKLLGEIPSATSGNQNCENSSAPTESQQVKRVQEEEDEKEETEETNLPDDQSLTSAFAELSYKDGAAAMAMGPAPLIDYNNTSSFQNNSVLLNGQYVGAANASSALKKLHQNIAESPVVLARSPNNHPSSGFGENAEEFKKYQHQHRIDYCQLPVDDFSGGVPLALSGVPGLHLVSNISPPPPVKFPEQQQFYLNAQSPLPYIHHNPHQQLNQPPPITWRQMEHEQYYYKMHQQYLYLQQQQQQLRNQQQFEGRILPVQENGNNNAAAVLGPYRLMNRTPQKTHNQIIPISRHIERCNQDHHHPSFWDDQATTISRSISKQTGPTNISHSDYNTLQQQQQQRLHLNFPEKILTRSHGINSLKSVKFGSFVGTTGQQPLLANNNINNQNGRLVVPNGGYCSNVGFHFDSLSSKGGSSPDMLDLKQQHNNENSSNNTNNNSNSNSLRPMLQRCGSIDEYIGRIYIMAKDQHGCRFLQRKFTEGTVEDVGKIFVEIIVHIVELMTDPFGNYLVQKLLEVCDSDQHMQILHSITRKPGDLVRISCDMHGTRAVQKVIETLKTPEQVSLVVSSLKPGIVPLIKNMNGNHVAQRCLQYLTPQYSEFLYEAATANCVELATDRHGCCVLQKCLSRSQGEQRYRLVSQITSSSLILCQDPFGNYVVQYVFEINLGWAIADILDQLQGNYGDLSMQKYSSNVVEKCLKYAGEERRRSIMQEILSNPRLDQIMQDPYGNYVIQAALNLPKGSLHSTLVEAIRSHVPVLRTSPYGKKVLSSNSLKK